MKVEFFRREAEEMQLPLQTRGWLGDTIYHFWMQHLHTVWFFFFFPQHIDRESHVPERSDKQWGAAHGSNFIALNGKGRRKGLCYVWSKSICSLAQLILCSGW